MSVTSTGFYTSSSSLASISDVRSYALSLNFPPAEPHLSKFPAPTQDQKRAIIDKIIELVVENKSELYARQAISNLTRKGTRLFGVKFNGLGEGDHPVFKGVTVTAELVREIVINLGFYFPKVELNNPEELKLPRDCVYFSFTLRLYPLRPMPSLGSTATVAERALHEYVGLVTKYYVGRDGINTASLYASEYILRELNLDVTTPRKTLCVIKSFSFNTKTFSSLTRTSILDGSEPLECLHPLHQIPTIEHLLKNSCKTFGYNCSVTVALNDQTEGREYPEGVMTVSVSDPEKVDYIGSGVERGQLVMAYEKFKTRSVETFAEVALLRSQADDLKAHFHQVELLKKLIEGRDESDPLVREIKSLRSDI